MQTVILVIHLLIVIALIGIILIQRSEGGGLGIGGGSGFMSARGTKNALTRFTAILAAGFFVTSILLYAMTGSNNSSLNDVIAPINTPASTTTSPVTSGGQAQPAQTNTPTNTATTPATNTNNSSTSDSDTLGGDQR